MENNNSSIKSTYLVLFILGIIEVVLTLFLGSLVAIAVFIVALILRSKLMEAGQTTTQGIKLMLIGSGIHMGTLIIGIFNWISSLLYVGGFFYVFSFIINIFLFLAIFIILIIGCIFIYKEYDAIKSV